MKSAKIQDELSNALKALYQALLADARCTSPELYALRVAIVVFEKAPARTVGQAIATIKQQG
jgi:hypothetical protein